MTIRLSPEKFLLLTVSAVLLFLQSCTKLEQTTLGGDLIPGGDKLITDTLILPVSTISSQEPDSTFVEKSALHVVGYYNDPMLGTTTGAAYFQLLPFSYPFKLPVSKDSLFLDSLVLSVSYSGSYGDTNSLTKVNVYKLLDPAFKANKKYRYNQDVTYFASDFLGTKSFKPSELRRGYKLAYKNDTAFNQLRIRLNDQLGRALLDQNNITGAFLSDSAFKLFLNGLALVPDSTVSGNAIHYFNLNNTDTRLNLYYRMRKTDGNLDTSVAIFPFVADTIRSANANKIHRNYTGSAAAPVLSSGQPASLAYVQTTPGTAVTVKIPGLTNLKGQVYIVHRAELVARQVFQGPLSVESIYTPPLVHLFSLNSAGQNAPIPFDSSNYMRPASFDFFRQVALFDVNTNYSGGQPSFFRDASSNLVAEYRMNMTRYVQNVINGKADIRDFKITAPYFAYFSGGIVSSTSLNPIAYGRVQLGGGTHPQYPMFVRIYYSKQ
jgi:hypothetical protein